MSNSPNPTLPWEKSRRPLAIAILGDALLDEYITGTVERISPEAPVPILRVTETHHVPGGAANVARNVKLAGGVPVFFSVVGDDPSADRLFELLHADEIETQQIIRSRDRTTIKKTRLYSGKQQLARVDWERVVPITSEQQCELLSRLERLSFDALLISDYAKGCLSPEFLGKVLTLAKKKGIPTVVDPKGKDFHRYSGATVVTPNRKEATEALNLQDNGQTTPKDMARALLSIFKLDNIVITLGAEGMYFLAADASDGIHLPARTREVFDVSGAGDTVAAIIALSLAAKSSMTLAMTLANTAAGIVVEKMGTQPVRKHELHAALSGNNAPSWTATAAKVSDPKRLLELYGLISHRQEKLVFTNGCFDIIHAGHISYLEEARSLGQRLIVGINTDRSIRALKGAQRPILPLAERMRVVCALACVDHVVPFDEDTPVNLISELLPDVLVKGADWPEDKIVGAESVKRAGGEIRNIALVPDVSTTKIIERIKGSP